MSTSQAKNTTDSPLVIDDDGHILGGGEWGTVDPELERVQAHVDAGLLVLSETGPESASSAAAGGPAGEAPPAPSTGSKAPAKKETT